jgi:hypothetical protein
LSIIAGSPGEIVGKKEACPSAIPLNSESHGAQARFRLRFARNPAKSPRIDKPAAARSSCTVQKTFRQKSD